MTTATTDLRNAAADVVLRGDGAYPAALAGLDVPHVGGPAAVVRPTAAEIPDVLAAARAAGLTVAPVSGRAAGLGPLDRTVVLLLDRLDTIEVDVPGRWARVGAGVAWEDLALAVSGHGLLPVGGCVPRAGLVGAALHGGLGWTARAHGLGADAVTAFDVITAVGERRHVDAEHEPDLFWALRGGGGAGLAVVIAMELELQLVGHVVAGAMFWPIERAAEVLDRWAQWTASAPDSVTTAARLVRFPAHRDVPVLLRDRAFVVIDGASLGGVEALAALRELRPDIDTFTAAPPSALGRVRMAARGFGPSRVGHRLLDDLPAAVQRLLEVAGPAAPAPPSIVELRQLGGAPARRGEEAGPLMPLTAGAALWVTAREEDGGPAAAASAIGRTLVAVAGQLAGRLPGSGAASAPEETFAPAALRRLRAIKASVDPDGLLRGDAPLWA